MSTLTIEESLRALSARPPEGKNQGAKPEDFAELEALTDVPPELRQLWAWANGCSRFFLRLDSFDQCTDDLYSIKIAVMELEMNREAGMREGLIPFAGEDGSGDSLVFELSTGRILYWNHEDEDEDDDDDDENEVAGSLAELLARSVKTHHA